MQYLIGDISREELLDIRKTAGEAESGGREQGFDHLLYFPGNFIIGIPHHGCNPICAGIGFIHQPDILKLEQILKLYAEGIGDPGIAGQTVPSKKKVGFSVLPCPETLDGHLCDLAFVTARYFKRGAGRTQSALRHGSILSLQSDAQRSYPHVAGRRL